MADLFVFITVETQSRNPEQPSDSTVEFAKECKPGAIKMVEEER